jgi:hypothetical protein
VRQQEVLELASVLGEIEKAARTLVDDVKAVRNIPLDTTKIEKAERAFAEGRSTKGERLLAKLRSRRP